MDRPLTLLAEADARELLPALPSGCVDLVVTDPPYVFRRGSYFRRWFTADLDDSEWPAVFRELHRVLVANAHAYIFCDWRVKPLFDAARQYSGNIHYDQKPRSYKVTFYVNLTGAGPWFRAPSAGSAVAKRDCSGIGTNTIRCVYISKVFRPSS